MHRALPLKSISDWMADFEAGIPSDGQADNCEVNAAAGLVDGYGEELHNLACGIALAAWRRGLREGCSYGMDWLADRASARQLAALDPSEDGAD